MRSTILLFSNMLCLLTFCLLLLLAALELDMKYLIAAFFISCIGYLINYIK